MIKEKQAYSLAEHNTFGIACKAHQFIEYTTVEELRELLLRADVQKQPLLHIGGGSNLLFLADYPGVVLHSLITGYEIKTRKEEAIYVRVGAGVDWDTLVEWCVAHNYYGIENLSAIPGEVGASAVQNIGAYGVEVKDVIHQVETVEVATGKIRVFTCEECQFGYRKSIFKRELKGQYIVTHVVYRFNLTPSYQLSYGNIQKELDKVKDVNLHTIRETIVAIRSSKLPDPKEEGNAGSFFMNPVIPEAQFHELKVLYPNIPHYCLSHGVKIPAAWLIDQCGWKGKSKGAAGVHHIQPLVLVNRGGATGAEIVALAQAIQYDVAHKFAIHIHPEVNFIG